MNRTTSAGAVLKSASETVFPFVSGTEKSGALVPSGNIVEGVKDMAKSSNDKRKMSRVNSTADVLLGDVATEFDPERN